MRHFAMIMIFFVVVLLCCALIAPVQKVIADDVPAQVLRHMVLFQFKADTTPEQVRAIETAFCRLPSATGVIYDFEWGTNVSPENLNQGYTHCFFLTFKNEADRDAYLPHPAHKEFGSLLQPHIEKVAVLDYWTKP
jgi:hypothetical protein